MSENALAVKSDFEEITSIAITMVKSGFFTDTHDMSQAVVKILAGRELGFGPMASMTGIYIVKGRVSLSANLMASAVKRTKRYNYRIVKLDDNECELAFFEGTLEVGRSKFTKADAQRAGTQNMDKFPRNMLFARAMSNGCKWYCPDIFGGPIYTPDELGAEVTMNADGDILSVTAESAPVPNGHKSAPTSPIAKVMNMPEPNGEAAQDELDAQIQAAMDNPSPAPATEAPKPVRPYTPEYLRSGLEAWANKKFAGKTATDNQRNLTRGMIEACFAGMEHSDKIRHSVTQWLTGQESMNDVPDPWVLALLEWLKPIKDTGGGYTPDFMAVREAGTIWTEAQKAAGQMEFSMGK